MKRPWRGARSRIGVPGSLHRQILDLCEHLGLVLVDVRANADPLTGHTLVFLNDRCITEVTIEDKALAEERSPRSGDPT